MTHALLPFAQGAGIVPPGTSLYINQLQQQQHRSELADYHRARRAQFDKQTDWNDPGSMDQTARQALEEGDMEYANFAATRQNEWMAENKITAKDRLSVSKQIFQQSAQIKLMYNAVDNIVQRNSNNYDAINEQEAVAIATMWGRTVAGGVLANEEFDRAIAQGDYDKVITAARAMFGVGPQAAAGDVLKRMHVSLHDMARASDDMSRNLNQFNLTLPGMRPEPATGPTSKSIEQQLLDKDKSLLKGVKEKVFPYIKAF